MRALPFARLLVVLAALTACDGVSNPVGYGEPVRSRFATFLPGDLESREDGPRVTAIELSSGIFFPGQLGRLLTGRASGDAFSVAFRLAEGSTGWWISPVEGFDPFVDGERTFELDLDIGEATPGSQRLRFRAVGEDGVAGPERGLDLCIAAPYPDNLNVCDPARRPPAAVVSLIWDREVDLDLRIISPEGDVIEAKSPRLLDGEGNTLVRHVRDSNSRCIIDGRRREDVIFAEPPGEGFWLVYTELFRACEEPSVRYTVEVRRRIEHDDGTFGLELTETHGGWYVEAQASGGRGPGTYVTTLEL